MLDTVKTLCYLSGVSGWEDEVRDYILERALPCADEIITDTMGNLLVFKKGSVRPAGPIMLCAHMDEVGLIITGITDEGYLKFDFIGGVDRRVVLGKRVHIGGNRVPGVIGIKAYHHVDKAEEKSVPKTEALYIDIGASGRKEAAEQVSLGDPAVFDDRVLAFGDGLLKAKALDNRVGCAVMLKLAEEELPCDCWFAFTVQEEVGCRGAQTAAFKLRPRVALVLEGTTAADLPGVEAGRHICRVGGGVVIPYMDKGAVYHRGLVEELENIARENNIKWQTKSQIAGGTDGSVIQRSRGGVKTAVLAVPVRNIHSAASVAKASEMEDLLEMGRLFLQKASREAEYGV